MSRTRAKRTLVVTMALWLGPMAAHAQEAADPHAGHDMTPTPVPASDSGQQANDAPVTTAPAAMDHGSMQGGKAPPDARDPHGYADGYDLGPYKLHMMGEDHRVLSVLIDRFEHVRTDDNSENAYDLAAWYGYAYDRAVVKAEGHVDARRVQEARTELLWGHAIAPFWDTQLGVRYDSGVGPNRSWLAFGVQGLAPYWFELDATAYIGDEGRAALRFDAEYELLLTQRLILQPRLDASWYSKDDPARGLGSGVAGVSAGVRLRYEIRREFAPYLGLERAVKYGDTADIARAAGDETNETRVVAGVRFWF